MFRKTITGKIFTGTINLFYKYFHYPNKADNNTIVFISGIRKDHSCWNDVVQKLLSLRISDNILVYDNRGVGKSNQPLEKEAYSGPAMVQDLKCILDTMHIEHSYIIGHSMGGFIVQAFACKYPEYIKKMVLYSTLPYLSSDSPGRAFLNKLQTPDTPLQTSHGLKGQIEFCKNHDMRKHLSNIKIKTLIISGDHDILLSQQEAYNFADKLPNSACTILEGGHYVHQSYPDVFTNTLISFLNLCPDAETIMSSY